MLLPIHDQAVIDLIRENDQLMAAGNVHNSHQQLLGIQGACGVIGIDNNDRLGLGCDLAFNIFRIGIPIGLFIADVMNRRTACQIGAGCPERVIR